MLGGLSYQILPAGDQTEVGEKGVTLCVHSSQRVIEEIELLFLKEVGT